MENLKLFFKTFSVSFIFLLLLVISSMAVFGVYNYYQLTGSIIDAVRLVIGID